jgi:diguanylate cyclase
MGRQRACFDPASYTLWYEHAAGLNAPLSRVLEERIVAGNPLTDADVLQLYAQYIATRESEAIERIQQRLLTLLQETSAVVATSGTHAVLFGETLEDHSRRLQQPAALDIIQSIVQELLSETQNMCAANGTLCRQLETRSEEVLSLTHRLERMQADALNDPLTGLLNRRGLERAIVDLDTGVNQLNGASLILADIDHFKRINDSHGHLIGDQVLCAVAQVLRARIKGSDISARLGGDEFAVLLPGTPVAGAIAVAEQIRTTLIQGRLRYGVDDTHIENITLSLGVAEGGAHEELAPLLHRADAALYVAKREGRDRVSVGELEPPPRQS